MQTLIKCSILSISVAFHLGIHCLQKYLFKKVEVYKQIQNSVCLKNTTVPNCKHILIDLIIVSETAQTLFNSLPATGNFFLDDNLCKQLGSR